MKQKIPTGEGLKTFWSEGSNSDAEDLPNATLIIDQQLQTLILLNMSVVGDQTIFTIQGDGPQSLIETSGITQVFIDTASIVIPSWQAVMGRVQVV